MATSVQEQVTARIPSFDDLAAKYPRHVGMAQGQMNPIWSLATRPATFLVAQAFAKLGFPPVTAIASDVDRLHRTGRISSEWDLAKQFAGVAIAVLMESNGYVNAGRKRGVPHPAWNVGSCFEMPTSTRNAPTGGASVPGTASDGPSASAAT